VTAPSRSSPFSLAEWSAIGVIIVVWGVNNAAAKVATEALPPLLTGGLRFVVALVCLSPFLRPPFPPWRQVLPIMLLTGPLHFGLIYTGFAMARNYSPLVVSLQLWIPITAIFAWRILGEGMRPAAVGGLVLAFGGMAGMTLDPKAAGDLPAILICLAASAMWALATILVRRIPAVPPLKMQAFTALITAPSLMGGALLFEHDIPAKVAKATPLVWASVVWSGAVSTIGATALLFWLVQRREPGRVTPFFLLTPLVSLSLGVIFLKDHISLQVALGGGTTLAGVAIVALSERRRAPLDPDDVPTAQV
jgi:O-acetylserine/cysteine efflux transporter